MYKVLRPKLAKVGANHIREVNEIDLRSRHSVCTYHWANRVHLYGGRSYAPAFTDRQLDWYRIIEPWEQYKAHRINTEKKAIWEARLGNKFDTLKRGHGSEDDEDVGRTSSDEDEDVYGGKEEEYGLPPFDVILDERPDNWQPRGHLSAKTNRCYASAKVSASGECARVLLTVDEEDLDG